MFIGYVIGAAAMILAGLLEVWLGVDAEGKPLEEVAEPLSAESDTAAVTEGGRDEARRRNAGPADFGAVSGRRPGNSFPGRLRPRRPSTVLVGRRSAVSAGAPTLGACLSSRSSRISNRRGISRRPSTGWPQGVLRGDDYQTLLGITGSGKTFTIAHMIERIQRPTLVISPNKSLAAQLANEFRRFFPNNAVEYFVSYYDYYQPEAYVPSTDTYIEKDSSINDEIERLRHSATASLLTRRDVLIVASVSCIYGLGSPEEYMGQILRVHTGTKLDMDFAIRRLVDIQYQRNNQSLRAGPVPGPGRHARDPPRVRGDRSCTSSGGATTSNASRGSTP